MIELGIVPKAVTEKSLKTGKAGVVLLDVPTFGNCICLTAQINLYITECLFCSN